MASNTDGTNLIEIQIPRFCPSEQYPGNTNGEQGTIPTEKQSKFCVEETRNKAEAAKTTSRIKHVADFATPERVSFSSTNKVLGDVVRNIENISSSKDWKFLHPDLKEAVELLYPKPWLAQRKAVAFATNNINVIIHGALGEFPHCNLLFSTNSSYN